MADLDLREGDAESVNVQVLFNNVTKMVKANAPEILTALGVSGLVTTAILTRRAAHMEAEIIATEKAAFKSTGNTSFGPVPEDREELFTPTQKFKLLWRCYVPPTVAGVASIACIAGASRAASRRTAAAVTAYSLTERAFSEYKEKAAEQIGKNKERKLRDEIAQDRVNEQPPKSSQVVILGPGQVLCCELRTMRYFRSDMEALQRAKNDVNHWINTLASVSLNDFYGMIGLEPTAESDLNGWDGDDLMDLDFSTVLSPDGDPCLAFNYNYVRPL